MTIETQPETSKYPDWLTRENYLKSLSPVDQQHLLTIESFIVNLEDLKDKFESSQATLFVVGSSAVPRKLLGKEPNDLDLRVVMKEHPEEFHELFMLMYNLYNGYNGLELSKVFGQPTFNWHYDEDLSTDNPFVRFKPDEGKPIDLFLPFLTYDYDLHNYLSKHKVHHQSLNKNVEWQQSHYGDEGREKALKMAYVVRLV